MRRLCQRQIRVHRHAPSVIQPIHRFLPPLNGLRKISLSKYTGELALRNVTFLATQIRLFQHSTLSFFLPANEPLRFFWLW